MDNVAVYIKRQEIIIPQV